MFQALHGVIFARLQSPRQGISNRMMTVFGFTQEYTGIATHGIIFCEVSKRPMIHASFRYRRRSDSGGDLALHYMDDRN